MSHEIEGPMNFYHFLIQHVCSCSSVTLSWVFTISCDVKYLAIDVYMASNSLPSGLKVTVVEYR